MLGQLGCSDYSARIVTRGRGSVVWEEMPFSSLEYERVLDDTSKASIVLDGIDPGCDAKAQLAKVRTWRHELAIYRDTELVWIGPVTGKTADGTRATITARDRSSIWDRRFIHNTYDPIVGDLASIFQTYFLDAMSVDPIAGFTIAVTATGITGARQVLALDHKAAGPEMREVSQIGIDWTVIGEACRAGGRTIPTGRLPVITDDHLRSTPTVEVDGLVQVNHAVITGLQPQDDTTGQFVSGTSVWGEFTDATLASVDGILELNVQDDKALDVASCVAGAQSTVQLSGEEAIVISELDLDTNAPLTIDQLIPGALIDVELTFPAIAVSDIYRISDVDVTVDVGGEKVKLTVQPIGTT